MPPGPGEPHSGLRRAASIDVGVVGRNIRHLVEAENPSLDARADAYGHGLARIARAAIESGVRRIRVSTGFEARAVETLGGEPIDDGSGDLGLGVYGFTTSGFSTHPDEDLDFAFTLSSEIVAIKRVAGGTGVSYGYTFRPETDTTLGLVALGYADGVPRLTSNRAFVSVAGSRHPVVGRIAMDQLVIDLGSSIAHVGDPVVLFGSRANGHLPVTEWADAARRSPADITSGLGRRVVRSTTGQPQ